MTPRKRQPALFPVPDAPAGGAVYQGTTGQFAAMFPRGDPDAQARKRELKGWVRLALSHARALDASPLVSVGRAQVSAEWREVMTYIAEAAGPGDAFERLLEEVGRSDHPPAPHGPV